MERQRDKKQSQSFEYEYIEVLSPEVVSQIAAGKMVENAVDSLAALEAITKLYELKRMAQENKDSPP
jgi:hypothetical protein